MKHVIHTPTEQYGYVETEFDNDAHDPVAVTQLHKALVAVAKPQNGLPSAEFNAILDEYLTKDSINGDPGLVERMSVEQVAIIQAIKRSRARTNK